MAASGSRPRNTGEGIVDLSNDAAWQARLDEARARRAEVLAAAGKTDAPANSRRKPWDDAPEEAEPAADEGGGGLDFHDRMNRFKQLSGVKEAPATSEKRMEEIDDLLAGKTRTLKPSPATEEAPMEEPLILSNGPSVRRMTPDALRESAAHSLIGDVQGVDPMEKEPDGLPRRRLWRLFAISVAAWLATGMMSLPDLSLPETAWTPIRQLIDAVPTTDRG